MEHWNRFIEVHSVFLFKDILPANVRKAWGHLRRLFLLYMRGSGEENESMQTRLENALNELRAFGALVEKVKIYVYV